MKPYYSFDEQITIPGLRYIREYITLDEESNLVRFIDDMPWITELKRRVQHYGYKYDYKSRVIDQSYSLGELPCWLDILCNKLCDDHIFNGKPDQIIVNEYMPGQGIAPHIDCIPCFSDTICSLSLASPCVMDLIKQDINKAITLQPRSLLVFQNEARYQWHHGIQPRKSDNSVKRQRRISLTFRKVMLLTPPMSLPAIAEPL